MDLRLDSLDLYCELKDRNEPITRALSGLLEFATGDATRILEFVRQSCPGFTDHSVQHSLRIISRVGKILQPAALSSLSSAEIFVFILAALFHDSGMTSYDGASGEEARRHHHTRAANVFKTYLQERLNIVSEHHGRLGDCVAFVMASHGFSWEEMSAQPEFLRKNMIMDETVRCNLLAILLRVGDLLDLDVDRTCNLLRARFPEAFQDPVSASHHDRHSRVTQYYFDHEKLEVTVAPHTREEHQIWQDWLGWLEQDIVKANTYVFDGRLLHFRLPRPTFSIAPAPGATYEAWPLRFEIDDSGGLWGILSRSIYTGAFDYVRELIQNSIDAAIAPIYWSESGVAPAPCPRSWSLDGHAPVVVVAYSANHGWLQVIDNGIGMNRKALERYLFRVAESGYRNNEASRAFPFPSIARFGIGFVSVLVRADRVELTTTPWDSTSDPKTRRVVVTNGGRDALVDVMPTGSVGTRVALQLTAPVQARALHNYFVHNIRYPSARIVCIDFDGCNEESIGNDGLSLVSDLTRMPLGDHNSCTEAVNLNAVCDDLVAASRRGKRYRSWSPVLEIPSERPRRIASDPSYVVTTPSLDAIAVGRGRLPKIGPNQTGLLFVPCYLVDDELGIEWASLHLLLISRGWATAESVFKIKDADGMTRQLGVRLTRDDVVNADSSERGYGNALAIMEASVSKGLEGKFLDVASMFANADIGTFQDGIRLPLQPWWIAPLGATRGVANFTAGARLALNVTRNTIDENLPLLRDWVDRIAVRIQQSVADAVVAALDDNKLAWEPRALWPSEEEEDGPSPPLFSCAAMRMRTLLTSRAKRSGRIGSNKQ